MIYYGKEKENHRGSHVRYCHCGKWHEGTLLEPVNYQFVVTKENPPAILSARGYAKEDPLAFGAAKERVMSGEYSEEDLKVLQRGLSNKNFTEVESVEITDANDITQEEADEIIERLLAERRKLYKPEPEAVTEETA